MSGEQLVDNLPMDGNSTIEIISSWTSEVTIALIIVLLFFGTLRTLIAYTGFTRGTKFEKYFYDKSHQELANEAVKNAYQELNIAQRSKSALQLICPQVIRDVRILDESRNLDKLLILLANNSHSCLSIYGKDTPVNTSVIINTMEASLLDDNCGLMAELFLSIYTKKLLRNGQIDFIVVPKSGNPILAKKLADMLNAICLVCKSDKDSSRVTPDEHSSNKNNSFSLNVEGFTYLQERARNSSVKLNGILVDCNCSGGNGLIRTAVEFNKVLEATGTNVNPIDKGMVLFRVDLNLKPEEFDRKFINASAPLTISRYVDLDENMKKELLALKEIIETEKGEIHKKRVTNKIKELVDYARDNSLLMI